MMAYTIEIFKKHPTNKTKTTTNNHLFGKA